MAGFEIYSLHDWLIEGIFTRRGTGRGVVESVRATLSGLACATVVAVTAASSQDYAVFDKLSTAPSLQRSDVKREVDPKTWPSVMALMRAQPPVSESTIAEPSVFI